MGTPTVKRALLPVPQYADLIGRPYKLGTYGPDEFDCYGLVSELHKRLGIAIKGYASPSEREEMAALMSNDVSLWEECEPGQGATVWIRIGRFASHVGFMVSDSKMIHAWEGCGGVTVEGLGEWNRRIVGYYKYKNVE
jgi:cell wall-associated NlpC family hydrolase